MDCRGYEMALAEKDARLESLRQQLADMTAAYTKVTERIHMVGGYLDQIKDGQKQVTMLRDKLTNCVCAMQDYQSGIGIMPMFDAAEKAGREALAATPDLKDVRLCHATPDSYRYKHHDSFGVGFFWNHSPTHQGSNALESVPLFTAWEPKP